MTADHVEKTSNFLPAPSSASLYVDFFRFLTGRLESVLAARRNPIVTEQSRSADLWAGMDFSGPDFPSLLDVNLFDWELQPQENDLWDLNVY